MKYQGKDLSQFANQLRFAAGRYFSHGKSTEDFDNIIICGLGGSGIAGRIIKSWLVDSFPLPIEIFSGYSLPAYAGERTLAILSSYSGNTEETTSMYNEAKNRNCEIVVIATGGELGRMATNDNKPFYKTESGFQPRMALGYSLGILYLLFQDLLGKDSREDLEKAAAFLSDEKLFLDKANELFEKFREALPSKIVIIGDYLTFGIGTRFAQQLQENAKYEAFVHELPEANHNVIETYTDKMDSIFLFLNSGANTRTSIRFKFLESLLKRMNNEVIVYDVNARNLNVMLEAIYVLDWLSLLIADYRQINSAHIPNINELKAHLSKA